MGKRLTAFVLALIMVLSVAGCSGSPSPDSATEPTKATEATEATVPTQQTEEPTEPAETAPVSAESTEPQQSTEPQSTGEAPTEPVEADDPQEDPEEAARQQAEEEARRKAEEEARQKAEEEARRKAEEEARQREEEEKRIAEQRNSFSMMYYLAITAEEIRTSKDNRMVLEEIYTSLLNDINPDKMDEITQRHLKELRDIIKSYLQISLKRERLMFVYNQEKAAAVRSAVPNPLAVLTIDNAMNWKKLALAVVYTAVDSYNNYKAAGESADLEFIMSGWELDDEEKENIMKNRDRAFDYMVDMVQQYKLDGLKTLNEKAIERFGEICTIENPAEKIRRLLSEESTYGLLGNYWLELADSYFETTQYAKCLECVSRYNELATGIYRKDFNYLRILPKAIVAAQATYKGNQYVTVISSFADQIMLNSNSDDWSTRYFAAQVYLDLYARTNNRSYLEKAYNITYDNVTILLRGQRSLNSAYLNPVVEQTVTEPDYRYMKGEKEKKEAKQEYNNEVKRAKEYNKAQKEKRKTECPSLYEPLIVNCELLFALADRMKISDAEKKEIEAVLMTDTNGIFIVKPINDYYSFSKKGQGNYIEFSEDKILIPVYLLTSASTITVTVQEKEGTTVFNDCVITKVERSEGTIEDFIAHITSKQLKKYEWTVDSKIIVEITYNDVYGKKAAFNFFVSEFEEHWYGDKVVFQAQ